MKKRWVTFSVVLEDSAETLEYHESYRAAAHHAQCCHDTMRRPKRMGAGFYELRTDGRGRYIARTDTMINHGFDWVLREFEEEMTATAL